MSKIQPEDLILINRDGVDYQAKVEDLPDSGGGDINLDGYAMLAGNEERDRLTVTEFTCDQVFAKNFFAEFLGSPVYNPDERNYLYRVLIDGTGVTSWNMPGPSSRDMPYNAQRNGKAFEHYDDSISPKLGPWQMPNGGLGWSVMQDGSTQSTGNKTELIWNEAYSAKMKERDSSWEYNPNALDAILPYQCLKYSNYDGDSLPGYGDLGMVVYWSTVGDLYIGEKLGESSSELVEDNANIKILREGTIKAKEFNTVEIKPWYEQDQGVEINKGGIKLHKGVGPWVETPGYPQHIGIHHKENQHPSFFIDDFGNGHLSYLHIGFYNTGMIGKDFPSKWESGGVFPYAGINLQGGMSADYVQINAAGRNGQTEDIISIQGVESNPTKAFTVSPAGTVTATEFVGDGSKLTGVGLPDFRTLTALS